MSALTPQLSEIAESLARGCEVCGGEAHRVVKRAAHRPAFDGAGDSLGCSTTYDPTTPYHPRCYAHVACDAWVLDGVKCPHCEARAKARAGA